MISIGSVQFTDRIESQIDWVDRKAWQGVGQSIRRALAGNNVILENPRSGRPITLTAELPWCWLSAATVDALIVLANQANQSHAFVYNDYSASVRFVRQSGPLALTPVNPLKTYYVGSIYLIEV